MVQRLIQVDLLTIIITGLITSFKVSCPTWFESLDSCDSIQLTNSVWVCH